VENCIVYNNAGTGIAGGFIYDCVVSNNVGNVGGGIDDASAYNCLVVNNSARRGGGIELAFGGTGKASGEAYNCIVSGNTAKENGGGIRGGEAHNCLVTGNYAANYGGGLSDTLAVNCTVAGNAAGLSGGGTYKPEAFAPKADLNSIVYGNTAPEFPEMQSSATASNCCSPTLTIGINGNINADPLFIDPASGDYRLLATSPCIDTGTNGFVLSTMDMAGNPRIMDGDLDGDAVVDMGTYEFPVFSVEIDIKPGSDTNPINLKSKGRCPVAGLTTEDFDAMDIDPTSVRFGGAAPVHTAYEDVDMDGDKDLLLHFPTQELELTTESTEAFLIGQTHDGQLLMGVDAIKIVPKGK
jgi:parallel beta-helix repeat protein